MNEKNRVRLVQRLLFCFTIAAVGILSDPMGISEGLEIQAQDPGNTNRTIDLMVGELLTDYPVLNELTQENSTGQIEHLKSLNSTESIQTLLALNALENLVELRDSQMLSYQSNQTAMANHTDLQ
jgi:hypothetical protein